MSTPVVLVVGASGFVGRHVYRHLRSLGWAVVGTRRREGNPEWVRFDLATERLRDRVHEIMGTAGRPTHVVNCAVMGQTDACWRQRELSYRINVLGAIHLIEDAFALGARSIWLTTGFIYDGVRGYYTDVEEPCPINEYGRQKAEVEEWCRRNRPETIMLRLDKVVGDDPADEHLFTEWYRWLRRGEPIVCMANNLIAPTHVDDVARAIQLCCERELSGTYNVANPEFFYRDELARQFLRILGCSGRVVCKSQEELNFADLRPEHTYLDSTRFQRATGIRFTSMRETIEAFKAKLSDSS